jgi:Glycosyltransferase family 87
MRDTNRALSRTPILAGLVVAALTGLALIAIHRTPRPVVAPRVAIRAALANPGTARALAVSDWNRVSASPLDGELERVDFWNKSQIQVEVAVNTHREVVQEQNFSGERVPYGDWLAYQPALLIGLSVLFLLVTAVVPWRRMRNLDALAALSFVLPVVLFQHRYLDPSLIAAGPGLLYLAARCAWRGIGPGIEHAPSRPLVTALAWRAGATGRVRWLRVALGVVALIFAMVGVSSPFAVDVAYAVMEGATALTHGVLPYGHMPPGILHADTYPILSYTLYTPLALVHPVRSEWDSVDGALAVAVAAALIAAGAALRAGAGPRGLRRTPEAEEAGLRAALAVLAFPALLISASTGTTDVVLAAMLAIALLLWRRPAAAAAALAVAGWFKLAPFALVPVLLASQRGRRMAAALGALAGVSALVLALVVVVGGIDGPAEMAHAVAYQFTRGSPQSIWSALGIEWAQPIAEGAVLGLITAATVRLWQQPRLASDQRRVAAVSAAVLIGMQLAANYWSFLYVVWVVPLLSVSLLAPGLAARGQLARVPPDSPTLVPALAA